MGLDDLTSDDAIGTDSAVVGSLGSGETVLGPAQGPAVEVQEGVFLLDTEPGLLSLGQLHGLGRGGALVRLGRRHVGEVGVAEDQDVVVAAERVLVDGLGQEVDVAVATLGLVG